MILAPVGISPSIPMPYDHCGISDPDLGFVAIAASANVQFNNSFIYSQTREYDCTD